MKRLVALVSLLIVTLLMTACASSDEMTEVTWDGNMCTVTGPTELPMGNHSFALIDLSDQEVDMEVLTFLEGVVESSQWMGPAKIDENGREVWTFVLDREGDYFLVVGIDLPDTNHWFCAQPLVVEASSE